MKKKYLDNEKKVYPYYKINLFDFISKNVIKDENKDELKLAVKINE